MNEVDYLRRTIELMLEFGIDVRDTHKEDCNYDDFYTNGNRLNGPRLFKIEWSSTAQVAQCRPKKIYELPPFKSAAYDTFRIEVPIRFRDDGRDDAIIHECVHFLQHTTVAEEKAYVHWTAVAPDWDRYVQQRVETEAHLVQIAYIMADLQRYWGSILSADQAADIRVQLGACKAKPALRVPLVRHCRQVRLVGPPQ
jgi:hypothetical protein